MLPGKTIEYSVPKVLRVVRFVLAGLSLLQTRSVLWFDVGISPGLKQHSGNAAPTVHPPF